MERRRRRRSGWLLVPGGGGEAQKVTGAAVVIAPCDFEDSHFCSSLLLELNFLCFNFLRLIDVEKINYARKKNSERTINIFF